MSAVLILAVLVLAAWVGLVIGRARGHPAAGLILGLALGIPGWLITALLPRPRPPAPTPLPPGAAGTPADPAWRGEHSPGSADYRPPAK